jgi:formylmethanofuran dehydrogenase subunit A
MTDLTKSAEAAIDAIDARYAHDEFRMAARLGAMQALVVRLAIHLDVYAAEDAKEKIEKIFLDYQER